MHSRGLVILLLSLLVQFTAGCALLHPRAGRLNGYVVESEGYRGQLLTAMREQSQGVRSFRTLLVGSVEETLGKSGIKQVVVFERPDLMRLEFLASGLNQLGLLVVMRNGYMQAFDQKRGVAYHGQASAANLEKLLSVPFPPEELMLLFAAQLSPPPEAQVEVFRNKLDPSLNVLSYSLVDGRKVRLFLSVAKCVRDGNVSGTTANQSGDRVILNQVQLLEGRRGSVTFSSVLSYNQSDVAADGGSCAVPNLPTQVSFKLPKQGIAGVSGVFRYDRPELNPELSGVRERLFSSVLPEGIEVVDLDR